MTLSAALVVSAIVALTLSPALSAVLMKRSAPGRRRGPLGWFGWLVDRTRNGYGRIVAYLVRVPLIPLAVLAAAFAGAAVIFVSLPTTFLPDEDQGAIFLAIQLPAAASPDRPQQLMAEIGRASRRDRVGQ